MVCQVVADGGMNLLIIPCHHHHLHQVGHALSYARYHLTGILLGTLLIHIRISFEQILVLHDLYFVCIAHFVQDPAAIYT